MHLIPFLSLDFRLDLDVFSFYASTYISLFYLYFLSLPTLPSLPLKFSFPFISLDSNAFLLLCLYIIYVVHLSLRYASTYISLLYFPPLPTLPSLPLKFSFPFISLDSNVFYSKSLYIYISLKYVCASLPSLPIP